MTASKGKSFMIVAVLLGVTAAVVGYYGLTSMASQATAQNNANYRNVVVTATDLTFGVKLDRPMLRTVRYPKESVPEGAFASLDSVVGQTTKVFMSAREPVTAIKLSSRGGGLSMLVRPNMRAASLEVNQVSGVSGFVLPGDRVDIILAVYVPQLGINVTGTPTQGGVGISSLTIPADKDVTAKMLIQNRRVLGTLTPPVAAFVAYGFPLLGRNAGVAVTFPRSGAGGFASGGISVGGTALGGSGSLT